jgi:hypothetical protein
MIATTSSRTATATVVVVVVVVGKCCACDDSKDLECAVCLAHRRPRPGHPCLD